MQSDPTSVTIARRLGLALACIAALTICVGGCAANKQRVDESFLKQVEQDPFPTASSKGVAAK